MTRARTFALDALCLALLVLLVLAVGDLILTTALNVAEDLARAAAMRGM